MATSMMMCLQAHGVECTEDEVADVMGCKPMKGASWEDALACAQHYGMRATLTAPATVKQLKVCTDAGTPVMIAWNPEGRPWSHASVVFHVDDDMNVHVADPNIPDPDETVRVVPKAEFYSKWSEKWPNYLVRRPAMSIEREISPDGRQMVANIIAAVGLWERISKPKGHRFVSDDIVAFLTLEPKNVKYKNRNVPSWADITNDGEMFADGHVSPREQAKMWEDHQKLLKQGWFWATKKVPTWHLLAIHKGANKAFEGWFEGMSESESLKRSGDAVDKMKGRRRPSWLTPVKPSATRTVQRHLANGDAVEAGRKKRKKPPESAKTRMKPKSKPTKPRDPHSRARAEGVGAGGAGRHHTRQRDISKGRSRKPKHKKDWRDVAASVVNQFLERRER